MKILIADPAKNITVFVLDPVTDPDRRTDLAQRIMADSRIKAEQVGFVLPPSADTLTACSDTALWHLEMAGGEFCGNATRSFGLYVARLLGFDGRTGFSVSVSGAARPVQVEVETREGWASAEMPRPAVVETLDFKNRPLPLLVFDGITHVIVPDLHPEKDVFCAIMSLAEEKLPAPAAFGVMFYETGSRFMRPLVYVRSVNTLVAESSCGSGSAALGIWLSRDIENGAANYAIKQPGGIIETEVVKKAGKVISVTIGGKVDLGEPEEYPLL